jgi:uncharacterized membrane protein
MPDLPAVWAKLRDSLWFVPTLIVLSAVLLAVAMVELSSLVSSDVLARWPRVFGAGAGGARSMLSAIATSMITVAGVTFSITMVAVTQASAQYSPRILRNFMRDRANQVVLGIFVGIFAYCLVVLRTIRGGGEPGFVPSVAVVVGVLMALLGIAVLIFFIHHIATTLQASEIIARIARETCTTVDQVFPEEIDPAGPAVHAAPEAPVPGTWRPLLARATGYIQRVDIPHMVAEAEKHDLVVRLERTAGDFVAAGQPLAWLARGSHRSGGAREDAPALDGAVTQSLHRGYGIGVYRTLDHDPGFGIRQLVDIALKALSPGINDTTTAVTCVDYLSAVLLQVANRRMDLDHRDSAGRLRVLAPGPTFEDLLDLTMDEIRGNVGGHVIVLIRQVEAVGVVAAATRSAARRRAAAKHVALLREAAARGVAAEHDRARFEAAADRVLASDAQGPEG